MEARISRGCGCTPTSLPPTPVFQEAITSSDGCLETCLNTGRRPTACSWLAYDIHVLHFKCQPLSAGRMFSSIKYEYFVQVSSNQKHIFEMFADVQCAQESISKQPWYVLPAVMRFCLQSRTRFAECRNKICLLSWERFLM